jgi:hypothetical protein
VSAPRLPGPDPGLADRVTRLTRADPAAVAAVYAAGQADGHRTAEADMAAAWRPLSIWVRHTAHSPSHAELQRLRGDGPTAPTTRKGTA